MDSATRDFVRRRAAERCEYCLLPLAFFDVAPHIEHIVARQHGGKTDTGNLALACHFCNLHKGPNLSGVDPGSGEVVRLFHPRRDLWTEHLRFEGAVIEGITAIGRVTVRVLAMNDERQVELRSAVLARGLLR
jgi:hypothetical protein